MFTPGPWKYIKNDCKIISESEYFVYSDDESERIPLCVIETMGAMGGEDTSSDAQLMSAAPEMLNALELALREMSLISKKGIYDFSPICLSAVINAIQKARG